MSDEKYLLRWNDFEKNLGEGFRSFRTENSFCDVTLACEDSQVQAHKVILSASSNFFKKVLTKNVHQHPLLYLKGVKMRDLEAIISYIYHGETNVALGELDTFLEVATDLQIKGLTSPPGSPTKKASQEPPRKKYEFETSHQEKELANQSRPVLKRPHTTLQDSKESILKVKKEYEVQLIEDDTPEEVPFPEDDYNHQNDFDSSMSGEIPYDYNQEGSNYHQEDQRSNNTMDYSAASEVKRLTDQYLQKIEVNGCLVWTCTRCGKQGKMKHHVREHIESNHIDCLTFSCPYCSKEMKNRVALRSHISKNHREENLRSKGLVV